MFPSFKLCMVTTVRWRASGQRLSSNKPHAVDTETLSEFLPSAAFSGRLVEFLCYSQPLGFPPRDKLLACKLREPVCSAFVLLCLLSVRGNPAGLASVLLCHGALARWSARLIEGSCLNYLSTRPPPDAGWFYSFTAQSTICLVSVASWEAEPNLLQYWSS